MEGKRMGSPRRKSRGGSAADVPPAVDAALTAEAETRKVKTETVESLKAENDALRQQLAQACALIEDFGKRLSIKAGELSVLAASALSAVQRN
jgi:hypothetical protein